MVRCAKRGVDGLDSVSNSWVASLVNTNLSKQPKPPFSSYQTPIPSYHLRSDLRSFQHSINNLQNSMPPRRHTCSTSPELHTSTSPHMQRVFRASYLHASTSIHQQRTSRPLYLHVATPTVRLQSSMPRCRHACSASTLLQTSIIHAATTATRV